MKSPKELLAKWGWNESTIPISEPATFAFQSTCQGLGWTAEKSTDWYVKLMDSTLSGIQTDSNITDQELFKACGGIVPSKGARRRVCESSDSSSEETVVKKKKSSQIKTEKSSKKIKKSSKIKAEKSSNKSSKSKKIKKK